MLHTALDIELPSQFPATSAAVRSLVESILGPRQKDGEAPDVDLEAMLLRGLSTFEALLDAFARAGFDDVVAVVIDGKPAYVDTQERIGDLQQALEGVGRLGAIARGYAVMRTTFCRRDAGLKILAELRCHAPQGSRAEEIRVRVSARPIACDPEEAEGPREYAARVREFVVDEGTRATHRATVQAVCDALTSSIPEALPGAQISVVEPLETRFIAPGSRQVGRMRHLNFGASRSRTVYCALPAYERIGPYDDPLSRHYYSPYQDLFHWLAVGEVLAGKVPDPDVVVVSATGRRLFSGVDGAGYDPTQLSVSRDVVRVSPEGRMKIDSSIPHVARLEAADVAGPETVGWGGEQWADDIAT